MSLNERQIALRKGGNYPALDDFFDRRKVISLPFDETAQVAVAAQFVLIDNTMTVASLLAVGTGTGTNAGLCSAELAGAVGAAATTRILDALGNVLNLVSIRDATTHDSIMTSGDREVYALVQSANGVADGASIGAPASENTQLSFVYIASDGTVTLTTVNATIEFVQNNVYLERHIPTIKLEGGMEAPDVISSVVKPFLWWTPNDAIFPSSVPASARSRNEHPFIAFDDSLDENIVIQGVMPASYNGGNITLKLFWVAATATTNSALLKARWERDNAAGHDIDADNWAAFQSVVSAAPGTSGVIQSASISFTQAQADGITAGDPFRLQIQRTGSSDTMSGDLQLLAISAEEA